MFGGSAPPPEHCNAKTRRTARSSGAFVGRRTAGPSGKKDKHAFRSHALKSRSKKRGRKGKKRAQVVVSKSRVPITSAMKKASPLGLDQRLLMKESGRFKYTHIPHGLFKANFDGGANLRKQLVEQLGGGGEPTFEARFVARAELQRWLMDQ